MLQYEFSLFWVSIVFYVAASIFFTYAVFFHKKGKLDLGITLSWVGLFFHSLAVIVRWHRVGHGPYLDSFESISSTIWMVIFIYLMTCYRKPHMKFIGIVTLPVAFLLIGLGLLANPQIQNLPSTFHTLWLIVHILFAKLTVGTAIIAFLCSIFYLIKAKKETTNNFIQRLPAPDRLDTYSFQFCGMAFVFWTISVIAGAIWAHKSWGRFWAWDPIELWSMITWLVFGIYMHLRRFYMIKGRRAAALMVMCFILIVATLFLVPFFTKTVHTEYLL